MVSRKENAGLARHLFSEVLSRRAIAPGSLIVHQDRGSPMILKHLKDRGLSGVQLVISDACRGLFESLGEHFPEARWQRCTVRYYRDVLSLVPRGKSREVAAMLKAIHAAEDRAPALETSDRVITKLKAMKLAKAAALDEKRRGDTSLLQLP